MGYRWGTILAALIFSATSAESRASITYPSTDLEIAKQMNTLKASVYAPLILKWEAAGTPLTPEQIEKLWRMSVKNLWRQTDSTLIQIPITLAPENRIKLLTNRKRKAFQMGGAEENPDPAPPFRIDESDVRPVGMPAGTYSLSSGITAYLYPNTKSMLRNETPVRFEIEFQQVAKDGRIAVQGPGSGPGQDSWGWDGRFEYQPDGKGGFEIVATQGVMELPVNLVGAAPDAPLLPVVNGDNEFRSRHLFKLSQWIPATSTQVAKLIVRDQGSIFGFHPTTEQRWIQTDANGKLIHAHGYGENFIPSETDARKPWTDSQGRMWRVFDVVTREGAHLRTRGDGAIAPAYLPIETRSVAAPMDPENPSQIQKGAPWVFMTANEVPGTTVTLPATVRYAFDMSGTPVGERRIQEDGTVEEASEGMFSTSPAVLNEGLNFYSHVVALKNRSVYIATNSAGEYTSGGLPTPNQKFYGCYVWYRDVNEGRIGAYHPVLDTSHQDLKDMFRDITQMYGATWGIGRPQLFEENGTVWMKAHMVDVDLLPEDPTNFPQSGYPADNAIFTNAYRRHEIIIPISIVDVNNEPNLAVNDASVAQDLINWTLRH